MKNIIVAAIIGMLAGCSTMDSAGYDSRSGASASGYHAQSNPRLDKQPDDMFHSWIN